MRETDAQGTGAWGDPQSTVILRCGVATPGPTTDACISYDDVDWVEDDLEGPEHPVHHLRAHARGRGRHRLHAGELHGAHRPQRRRLRHPADRPLRQRPGPGRGPAARELTGASSARGPRPRRSAKTIRPVRHQRSHGSSCGQWVVSDAMPRLIRSGRVDGRVSGRMLIPMPRCGSSTMRRSGPRCTDRSMSSCRCVPSRCTSWRTWRQASARRAKLDPNSGGCPSARVTEAKYAPR
ncbi:DUF3515 family protein [Clavibacter tessellarius]